jgi:hypothetical protein
MSRQGIVVGNFVFMGVGLWLASAGVAAAQITVTRVECLERIVT